MDMHASWRVSDEIVALISRESLGRYFDITPALMELFRVKGARVTRRTNNPQLVLVDLTGHFELAGRYAALLPPSFVVAAAETSIERAIAEVREGVDCALGLRERDGYFTRDRPLIIGVFAHGVMTEEDDFGATMGGTTHYPSAPEFCTCAELQDFVSGHSGRLRVDLVFV